MRLARLHRKTTDRDVSPVVCCAAAVAAMKPLRIVFLANEVLDGVRAVFGRTAPLPPLFVSFPGTALDRVQGPSATSLVAAFGM
jgi:hypothetical protein